MASEMVERVAKAISGSGVTSPASIRKARAAIEAMREPTEAMISGMRRSIWEDSEGDEEANGVRRSWEEAYRKLYLAAIDGALKS